TLYWCGLCLRVSAGGGGGCETGSRGGLNPLQDVQTAAAVDEVEQTPAVDFDVVARHPRVAARRLGQEVGHLAGSVRVGHVYDTEAMGEPRHRDLGPGHALARTGGAV